MKSARHIMTQDVVTVNKTQPISDLSKLFIENHFNEVSVLNDAEKVIGVVTQGDLIEQNKKLCDKFRGLLVEKSNFQIG
jgi:CBS-domain-containing membrane protein